MPNFALIRFSPISDVLSPRRVSRNSAFSWLTFSIAKCAHSSDYFNFCSMIMWRSVMICVCSLFWIYYIYICKLIITFISFLLSLTLIWLIYFRLNDYSSEFHKVNLRIRSAFARPFRHIFCLTYCFVSRCLYTQRYT